MRDFLGENVTVEDKRFGAKAVTKLWKWKTRPPHSTMFVVTYADGRTAYVTVEGWTRQGGDAMARTAAREHQDKGNIPAGDIVSLKRVR